MKNISTILHSGNLTPKDTTIREMLKDGFMIAYNKGILDEYRPLAVSNHADLLDKWISIKIEARNILLKHIQLGELVLRQRTPQESRKEILYSKGLYDGELQAARIEAVFRAKRQDLINNYAKLLAIRDLIKRLQKIYEIDLAYHVDERLKILRDYIEENNQAIRVATNTDGKDDKPELGLIFKRGVLHLKDDLLIDVETIKPDEKAVSEHEQKLLKILGDF